MTDPDNYMKDADDRTMLREDEVPEYGRLEDEDRDQIVKEQDSSEGSYRSMSMSQR